MKEKHFSSSYPLARMESQLNEIRELTRKIDNTQNDVQTRITNLEDRLKDLERKMRKHY